MKSALTIAAVAEIATGLGLMIFPSIVVQVLFGQNLDGVAIPIAHVAGIAIFALGIACWPGTPLIGMLIYGALVAVYLAYLGLSGGPSGVLLWPAVAVHVILSALLTREVVRK